MVVLDACEDWRFAKNVSHRVSVLLVLSCPFFFVLPGFIDTSTLLVPSLLWWVRAVCWMDRFLLTLPEYGALATRHLVITINVFLFSLRFFCSSHRIVHNMMVILIYWFLLPSSPLAERTTHGLNGTP